MTPVKSAITTQEYIETSTEIILAINEVAAKSPKPIVKVTT